MFKPSALCKMAGLKNLEELATLSDTQTQTLTNWYRSNPKRFECVLLGACAKKAMNAACLIPRD